VRVIGDEGEQIGIMAPFEALKMAREKTWTWWRFPDRATPGLSHHGLWEIPVPE